MFCSFWKPLAWLVLTTVSCLTLHAQDPYELLHQAAQSHRRLHSYHISGDLTTTLTVHEQRYRATWTVDLTRADHTVLPADSPSPALPQFLRFGGIDWRDGAGNPSSPPDFSLRTPSGWAGFDGMDEGVHEARLLGTEALDFAGRSVVCQIVEVLYRPGSLEDGISARPVRYSIDAESGLILRVAFRAPHSSLPEPLEWVFTARSIRLNQPPPDWALLQLERWAGHEVESWIGRAAPDFTLPALDGRPVRLSDLGGKVVLLAFWATWCEPCRYEAPMFERLAKEFDGLDVWGVTNDSAEKAAEWLTRHAAHLPTLLDRRREAQRAYGVERIPVTVVIGRDGRVCSHIVGLRSEAYFRKLIEEALR
jgi:peroxiredoxin